MPNHVLRDRIWASKKLVACSVKAALAYPWIYLVADDWGRFEYRASLIWGKVFAGRDDVSAQDVSEWLKEYEKVGLLVRYHIDGELAYWVGFDGRSKGKRRPSHFADPEQFEGVKIETGDESVRTFAPRTELELELEQNRTEGARAPKPSVRKLKPDTSALDRAVIDAYNRVMECRIGYTAGNLEAASRATSQGYTLEQAEAIFAAVKEKRTPTGLWCALNNHSFEYLTRPAYKKQGVLIQGPLDKIPNELASLKPQATTGIGIAAEMSRALAEKAAKQANG